MNFVKTLALIFFLAILGSPVKAVTVDGSLAVTGAVDLGTSVTKLTVNEAGDCSTGNVCGDDNNPASTLGFATSTNTASGSVLGEIITRTGNNVHLAVKLNVTTSGADTATAFQITSPPFGIDVFASGDVMGVCTGDCTDTSQESDAWFCVDGGGNIVCVTDRVCNSGARDVYCQIDYRISN